MQPYEPTIPLLDIYHKEKENILKDLSTPVFIIALITIAKSCYQPRSPETNEQIMNMWQICTMENYITVRVDAIMQFAAIWMELKDIVLTEVSQKEEDKCSISPVCAIRITR